MAVRTFSVRFQLKTVGALAAAVLIAASAAAAPPEAARPSQHEHPSPAAIADDHPGTAERNDAMAMKRRMMTEQGAADARLQLLVEKMNAAHGQAKVDAMAAVVVELVGQRATMRAHMDHMSRMSGMMGPMMPGSTSEMRKMAEQCPMMKESAEPTKP